MVVVSVATKQFWRLAELREKPLCSRARWLFLSLLPRQRLDCPAAAEPNVPGLALHEPPLRRLEVFLVALNSFCPGPSVVFAAHADLPLLHIQIQKGCFHQR